MRKRKNQCEETVFTDYNSHRCLRNGSVEREGKWYCKQHDPVIKAERDRLQQEKWDAERDVEIAKRERIAKCRIACEGFDDPMELRRQRDEAVGILNSLLEEDIHEPTCAVPASSVLVATSLVARISKSQ